MRRLALITVLLVFTGCAARAPVLPRLLPDAELRQAVELTETPFYPQEAYQCGPAALATVLVHSGVNVEPQALVDQVYLPARKGSLQAEIIAAARRHQRIPYLLDPSFTALTRELLAGRPVLVLQNLALDTLPVWHYAVVVGLEPDTESVILRSGTTKRKRTPMARFVNSWRRGQSWALVLLKPGELPEEDDVARYLRAVAAAETTLTASALQDAYGSAVQRWPMALGARFGLARSQQLGGHPELAIGTYRSLLEARPGNPLILNNLAQVQLQLGCHEAAQETIRMALSGLAANDPLRGELRDTREDIRAAQPRADQHPACTVPIPQNR